MVKEDKQTFISGAIWRLVPSTTQSTPLPVNLVRSDSVWKISFFLLKTCFSLVWIRGCSRLWERFSIGPSHSVYSCISKLKALFTGKFKPFSSSWVYFGVSAVTYYVFYMFYESRYKWLKATRIFLWQSIKEIVKITVRNSSQFDMIEFTSRPWNSVRRET